MNEITEILTLLNPWWKESTVSKNLAKEFKRQVFDNIKRLINYRQIVLLSGLRRVGKTTLLYQIIEHLINNTDPKRIVFFSFDKKVEEIIQILDHYQEVTGINWKKEKIYVFFDELTKLEDWANKLKIIYDSFPNLKLFVSSSSSLILEEDAIKNLGGRYFIANLKPLSFSEFLELDGKQNLIKNHKLFEKEIQEEFHKYLLRSFPEIVKWKDELLIRDYLRSTIIDKIIKSDLPDKFKNTNKNLLIALLELFYKEPGFYLDYDSLSKSLRISKKTLIKHIYYLEFSYLIKIVRNFRVSTLSSMRKLQRVYAYWWTLAYCYGDNIDKITENIVASSLDAKNYWTKGGKEIDFIVLNNNKIMPIEVKNKNELRKEDIKTMVYFLKKYKIKEGFFVYNGEEKEIYIDKLKINLIPLWKWMLKER